jgi:uncharacterized delta-60 repeat protein
MCISYKESGTFKEVAPYCNVGGTWEPAVEAWTKVSGEWRNTYLAEGTPSSALGEKINLGTFGVGFNGTIDALAVQSDGKLLVGGEFSTLNGATVSADLVRLNSNGTLDTSFSNNLGTGFNGTIRAIAIQSDGKILAGGEFSTLNGVTVPSDLIRLNADGTLDTAFNNNLGTGFDGFTRAIAVQSDGKILAGGGFTTLNGVTVPADLIRLNSDGTLDTTFNNNLGTGFVGSIFAIAVQSDGKILAGGGFTTLNGVAVSLDLVRLNSNGTLDTAFNTNLGAGSSGSVLALAVQSDGKILAGGGFTQFNGNGVDDLVRLNSDGTLDTTFNTNLGAGFNGTIDALAVQSDGKLLVGGNFTTLNGVTVPADLVRLNSDGTLDTSFNNNLGTGFDGTIYAIAIQSDGKILVGGGFSTLNGERVSADLVRLNSDGEGDALTEFVHLYSPVQSLAVTSDGSILVGEENSVHKINADGTPDTSFNLNLGSGFTYVLAGTRNNRTPNAIVIQSDGKILVGGGFNRFNEATRSCLVRLNSDGTEDTAFYTNLGSAFSGTALSPATVSAIAVQSDGKILAGGNFFEVNGNGVDDLVRLNSNGTLDTAFNTNLGAGSSGSVLALAVQSDGKILVGGGFTQFNGNGVDDLVRLNSNGTVDTAFTSNLGTGFNGSIDALAVQSDGKILAGGEFSTLNGVTVPSDLIRLNADGTLDTAFNNNLGTGFNGSIEAIAVQSDGKILAAGSFTTLNGVTVPADLVRLNSNGTLDTTFNNNLGTGFDGVNSAIAVQSDGKILVGGSFTSFNGLPQKYAALLGVCLRL